MEKKGPDGVVVSWAAEMAQKVNENSDLSLIHI